jgi:hypothetical protein
VKYSVWSQELHDKRFISFDLGTSDAFNDALARIILDAEPHLIEKLEHTVAAGITRGTTSTWKHHNVLTWNHPECAELRRLIVECVTTYLREFDIEDPPRYIQCWCNVLRAGEKFETHDHGCRLSGVYYVHGVTADDGGLTYYSHDDASDEWLEIQPKRGMLNLFQGDIWHFVSEYKGASPRISIAFDVLHEKQQGYYVIPLEGEITAHGGNGSS